MWTPKVYYHWKNINTKIILTLRVYKEHFLYSGAKLNAAIHDDKSSSLMQKEIIAKHDFVWYFIFNLYKVISFQRVKLFSFNNWGNKYAMYCVHIFAWTHFSSWWLFAVLQLKLNYWQGKHFENNYSHFSKAHWKSPINIFLYWMKNAGIFYQTHIFLV